MNKKHFKQILCTIISACTLTTSLISCGNTTDDEPQTKISKIGSDIEPQNVVSKEIDDHFTNSYANFSLELFKNSVTANENSLISPLSVMFALSMTANGADGVTRDEMQKVLGGDIPIETLNEYLYTYMQKVLSDNIMKIGNSIWFDKNKNISVEKDFLQTNANYYSADIYSIPFDNNSSNQINNWVKEHTDNMINKIIDEIPQEYIMCLLNAIAFDAKWEQSYKDDNIFKEEFTDINGNIKSVDMLHSEEGRYIKTDDAVGFIKSYSGGKYSFAALLPNNDININDYIKSLDTDTIVSAVKNAKKVNVEVTIPKFKYEYSINMNEVLQNMGIVQAFSGELSDFSNITTSSGLYISDVLHKTFISVDENGTKAAAVTGVFMSENAVNVCEYSVKLNRPFVYMIFDNENSLPIFMGTVMKIND